MKLDTAGEVEDSDASVGAKEGELVLQRAHLLREVPASSVETLLVPLIGVAAAPPEAAEGVEERLRG